MWSNAISKEENYEKKNAFAVSFIYNGDSKLFGRKTKSGGKSELDRKQIQWFAWEGSTEEKGIWSTEGSTRKRSCRS